MSESQLPTRPSVRVIVNADGNNILALEGLMREERPDGWFLPLIDELHERAVAFGLSEIVLDLRRLAYANAAAWKCLVYWLKKMHQDSRSRYQLRILCDEAHHWQQVGMPALRIFGGARLRTTLYRGDKIIA
jgi:hypothetical protein